MISPASVLLAHVVEARRLHMDLIAAGQTNTNVVEGWDWFVWDFHPSISIGLGILTALYFWVIGPARRRWNLGREATKLEKGFFISAVVTLELSLDGPIHHLADNYLFSVHMFQHLMITLIGPLLLLAGIPGWVWEQVLRVPVLGGVFRWAVKPVWAFLIYNGVLIAFHLPGAYNATMVDHNIHILEHLLFMASAVLVWWPILSRAEKMPPLTYGAQMIYLLAMSFPMKALGAVITVKEDVLYGFYAAAPRVWGLTPGGDQRLGGLMMWLPAGLVLWFLAARAFTLWWTQDRRERQVSQTVAGLLVALTLSACSASAPAPEQGAQAAKPGLTVVTRGGEYTAQLLIPEPVDMRRMFVLPVTLTNKAGDVVDRAQLEVDATMPEHGHGMMTEPKPSAQMECDGKGVCSAKQGRFLIDGFRLHMPGSWLFSVKVTANGQTATGEARYEF